MKVRVIEKDKQDRSNTVKLILNIYENDYAFNEHDNNVIYPMIDKYPALVRFEFTKSSLYVSIRKQHSKVHHIVRVHIKCEKLDFSETLTCSINWIDWANLGKLPRLSSASASDGKVHILRISLNSCEMMDKTFINLLDDQDFYDVMLVSDDKVPGNVAMHRAVLSAHSRTFRAMLLSEWKDALEVKIKMNEATHQTLLDLREYLYLGLLPNRNLLPLLLLAKNYKFDSVMKECIFEIVNMVDSDNLLEFRQFAIENELTELIEALHQITSDEVAKATYRLEMLKVSQVNARSLLRKTGTSTNLHRASHASTQSLQKGQQTSTQSSQKGPQTSTQSTRK